MFDVVEADVLNVAVMLVFPVISSTHTPIPLQLLPDHPANVLPLSEICVSVMDEPLE